MRRLRPHVQSQNRSPPLTAPEAAVKHQYGRARVFGSPGRVRSGAPDAAPGPANVAARNDLASLNGEPCFIRILGGCGFLRAVFLIRRPPPRTLLPTSLPARA